MRAYRFAFVLLAWVSITSGLFGAAPVRAQSDTALDELAALAQLVRDGKDSEAISVGQHLVARYGSSDPKLAATISILGRLYIRQGRLDEAKDLYKRALEIYDGTPTSDQPEMAATLRNLANVYAAMDRLAEAEPLYLRSIAIYERALGGSHPDVGTALNELASLYAVQGRFSNAEPIYRRALAVFERASKPADRAAMARSLQGLAGLYASQGRFGDAEPLYESSIVLLEELLGRDHARVAATLSNLAALHAKQGRFEQANALYMRSLAILERSLGPEHPEVGRLLRILGNLYQLQSRFDEAEQMYRRSVAIAQGRDSPDLGDSLTSLAMLYQVQGRFAEAEPLYKDALAIYEKGLGSHHPNVGISLNNLGELYRAQNRLNDAEPFYKRALDVFERVLGPDHPNVGVSLNNLGELYRVQNRLNDAEPLHKRALDVFERVLGPDHPDVGKSLNSLATIYVSQSRYGEAESLLRRVSLIQQKEFGIENPTVARTWIDLAMALAEHGSLDEAVTQLEKALKVLRKSLGDENTLTRLAFTNLGRIYQMLGTGKKIALLTEATTQQPRVPIDIEILSPEEFRGALLVTPSVDQPKFVLVARVTPIDSVRLVMVDNISVPVDPNGNIRVTLTPQAGTNRLTIAAIDQDYRPETKSLEFTFQRDLYALSRSGMRYALVIGVKGYDYLPPLSTSVNDARAVATVLQEYFSFKTEIVQSDGATTSLVLLEATLSDVQRTLKSLQDLLRDDDSLLIYFAGHGKLIGESKEAYWVLKDGKPNDEFTWLSASTLVNSIRRMKARSILIVSDSCFSGAMTRDPPDLTAFSQDRREALLKAGSRKSRIFISSGGTEPVLDRGCPESSEHSIFACAVLRAMREIEVPIFSSGELHHMYLLPMVSGKVTQQPERREIRDSDHANGDFIFAKIANQKSQRQTQP
jgi:tetratricopeptide (TPR) repeat protein